MSSSTKPRSLRRPSQQQPKVGRPTKSPWHAVSLILGKSACPAARELGRRRWLSAEAPRFPLPGCTVAECGCRYKHHADRRSGPRRNTDQEGRVPRHYDGAERRGGRRDRRKS